MNLIAVGRLVPRKGFDTVLKAMNVLRQRGLDLVLRIVGDGPERDALESLTSELDLRECVSFVGYVPRERMCHQLSNADVLVSGSVQEGFSMSMLESLASGVPVVGFEVGGLAELVIQGKTGTVAHEETPSGLAEAVQGLLPVTRSMRSSCVAMGQRYSSAGIADRVMGVLERAVGIGSPDSMVVS